MDPLEALGLFLFVVVVALLLVVVAVWALIWIWRSWRSPLEQPESAVPSQYLGIPIASHPSIDDGRVYLIGTGGRVEGIITGMTPADCPPFLGEGASWPQHPPMPYDWRRDRGFSCRKSS